MFADGDYDIYGNPYTKFNCHVIIGNNHFK
jgi:hypothetical protein